MANAPTFDGRSTVRTDLVGAAKKRYCGFPVKDRILFVLVSRVAVRFFRGVPQPPPPWRLLPGAFLFPRTMGRFTLLDIGALAVAQRVETVANGRDLPRFTSPWAPLHPTSSQVPFVCD